MSPFDPNNFSGTKHAIDGDYFQSYISHLNASTYSNSLVDLGDYIIMPVNEERLSGGGTRYSAPLIRITTVNSERHVNTS
jgi:hypothetical protein